MLLKDKNKMFKRMMSAILSLSLLINPVMAQESSTEDNFDLSEAPMQWAPQEKEIDVGNLRLTVWILPRPMMVAPTNGYLVLRGDFGQIKERMDNMQAEIDRLISEERASCDTQLAELRESCKRQQADLRVQYDAQVVQITNLNTNVASLEENVFLYKILASVGGVAALSLGIFALSK